MDKTWILIANASTATLYDYVSSQSKNDKPELKVIQNFNHPESRKNDGELVTDKEGSYASRGATGGHYGNFVEASDPHQYQAKVFAHELFQKLEQGKGGNQYKKLILVASPHFLGLLRQCIDEKPFVNISIQEIKKDLTKEKPHSLIKLLVDELKK